MTFLHLFFGYGRYKSHLCSHNTNDPLLDTSGEKKKKTSLPGPAGREGVNVALLGSILARISRYVVTVVQTIEEIV